MNNLSVKVKVLALIITLSVLSLTVFAYLTFNSYIKDKVAFVYDYLATDTQSRSKLFANTVEGYDFLLGSIISGLDFKTRHLSQQHLKFLQKNKRIQGLYYHISEMEDLQRVTMFETREKIDDIWNKIENAPTGISIVNAKKGTFILKKDLSSPGSYAAISFKQTDLVELVRESQYYLLNLKDLDNPENKNSDLEHLIQESIDNIPTPYGLFQLDVNGEKFFVSYSRLNFQDIVFVNMMKESEIYKIQNVLINQIVLFLILITSISLLIGTLSARWLTWKLDQLTSAAIDLENEQFSTKVEVTSKDELGRLGLAFNTMSHKILTLLNELRRYNTELELMVQERTSELKKLSDIQKGMLNSLGQGFVLINRDGKILPIYSKVAESMFDVIPSESDPGEILSVSAEEAQSFKELYQLVFDKALDFEDMVQLKPDSRSNSQHQQIALNYAPIKNGDSDDLEYILVIGTDKTAEYESIQKFKKEWNFSQMVMKIASNRFSVIKVIDDAFNMLSTARASVISNKEFSMREVQRLIHTIKGGVSYFYIDHIKDLCHNLETDLTPYYNTTNCSPEQSELVLNRIDEIEQALKKYVEDYDSIIQYNESSSSKSISITELDRFLRQLVKKDIELARSFKAQFYQTQIAPYFQMYPSIISDLEVKLNKEANFLIEGSDLKLPDGPWNELFGQFIHIVRNTMDHGIEPPDIRESLGKPREGTLKFKFERDNKILRVTISDDGQGLDWKKIAEKDPTVQSEQDAIERIRTGGISSKDDISDVSGRGVGVSSVFSTVEKWGGRMEVINNPGKGIAFIIEVPLNGNRSINDIQHLGAA